MYIQLFYIPDPKDRMLATGTTGPLPEASARWAGLLAQDQIFFECIKMLSDFMHHL